MQGVAAEPAVDWRQVVAALAGSGEWRQLCADLAALPGGPAVGALLRRAAAALCAAPAGGEGGAGPLPARLAEAVQQVAWEKLHTGDWHAVPLPWRDAYAAACVLAAAAGLPAAAAAEHAEAASQAGPEGSAAGASQAAAAAVRSAGGTQAAPNAELGGVGAALWHLDMAAIMGGPLLRPLVDALIGALQARWQQLHAACGPPESTPGAGAAAPGAAAPDADAGEEGGRAAKRRRQQAADGRAQLPPWSLGPRGAPVASARLPSLEAFWRDYMAPGTPLVIDGAMEDWPALQRWRDPAYLVSVAGPRTVPVEVGQHYLAEGWGQQLMTLQRFVQAHILAEGGGRQQEQLRQGPDPQHPDQQQQQETEAQQQQGEEQRPDQQQQNEREREQHEQPEQQQQQRGYLAQHPLFEQIPALAGDIREPPYCCLGDGEVQSVNAWFGPAGTVTPLHTDPHANLLCQAVGRKYVRLYSPACTPAMYPHADGMHTNTARVDADAPDTRRFPLFAQAPFQDCVLEPGQMLFIPPGWWHYVRSTTVSFSVSFWWR